MAKVNKKLSAVQNQGREEAKVERQQKYEQLLMNRKQVRIKSPPTIDGIDVDEYIERNADLIWLHQNEMWEFVKIDENKINIEEDGLSF